MHSTRIRTVCTSSHLPGGVCPEGAVCPGGLPGGGVSAWRVSARGGCVCPGGCLPGGVSAQGVSAWGCLADNPLWTD